MIKEHRLFMQADYLAISKAFHTVFITGVPQLNVNTLPQARRLILLIDALYEHRVMVVFSAAKVPTELFDKSDVGCVQSEQTMNACLRCQFLTKTR
eukprot:COSAG06_NODE_208_length_20182_cov_31.214759_5_plen_96_part_00